MAHLEIKKSYQLTAAIFLIALLVSSILPACYYDNAEELYPPESCESSVVSFNREVEPILQSACYSCHDLTNAPALGDGINLEGHFNFSKYALEEETKLIGSLKWNGGGSPMPKNGSKLDNCSINKIEVWIEEGRINN